MIYLVLGRRQLGKTTLAYSMARKCPRRLIFDPRGQIHSDGFRVRTVPQLDAAMDDLVPSSNADPLMEILVTPDADVQGVFHRCAQQVKSWADDFETAPRITHRLMFLIDEARFVKLLDSPAFEYVMRAAPPDLLHIVITGHRPANISTEVRAIADHWLLFRITLDHDLKALRDECGERVCAQVARLQPRQYLHWDAGAGVAHPPFINPAAWYVPLSSRGASDDAPILPENTGESVSVDTSRLFER